MGTSAWSTQQLAEFVVAVCAAGSETSAAIAAVERAAEALGADGAAIVCGSEVISAIGDLDGTATAELECSGAAVSPMAASLEHPSGATLVIARGEPLTGEEAELLRGMARVASMTMRTLRDVDDQRPARAGLERLAGDEAALRRVATLVADATPPEDLYAAVASEIAHRLGADAVKVLRYEADDTATIVGGWAVPGMRIRVGARLIVEGGGLAGAVLRRRRPVHVERFDGPPGSIASHFRSLGLRSGVASPVVVENELWGVAIAASTRPQELPAGSETRLAEFTELVATAIANAEARTALRRVADEQAALRHLATLVARGRPSSVVFTAVAESVGRVVLGADVALVGRYEPQDAIEFVGGWSSDGDTSFVGVRVPLGGHNVSTLVSQRNEPARVDHLSHEAAPATALARNWARSSAGAPINVEGQPWGVMIVASSHPDGLPPRVEYQLADFTELVATAIANTQARTELGTVADEQAALRRVATLVARDAPPAEVFAAVAAESGGLFAADETVVVRYETDATATAVGVWSRSGDHTVLGARFPLGGGNTVTAAARGPGARSAVGAPILVEGRRWGALQVASSREDGLSAGTEERLAGFAKLAAIAIANAQGREDLQGVADEQAALRRVATLVARAASPSVVFAAVAEEVGRLLSPDRTFMARYQEDDTVAIIAAWSASGARLPVGIRRPFDAGSLAALVRVTGRPARVDRFPDRLRPAALDLGLRSGVAAPITVEGRLWGLMVVASAGDVPAPPGTEERLADFTELVATAVANAETQAELTASRARILATADETRRRIERDLHDGAQQRLVTLALQLRATQAAVPAERAELAEEIDRVAAGFTDALDELRDFARGIHPAVLAAGGLGPALGALARRSAVPVVLDVRTTGRLRQPVEVAAYYVVSEALTNATKYAQASSFAVDVAAGDDVLRVRVRDDGVGGARFTRGSGLSGLRDRVEALGGRMALQSEPGQGTLLAVELPLSDDAAAAGTG